MTNNSALNNIKRDLTPKIIYYLSLAGFFAIFSTTISKSPILPLYVQALGGSEMIVGLISAFSPLAGILFSFPIGLMSDKIGRKKLLLISGVIFLIAPLLYLFVRSPFWLIPVRFFHGIATAILGPIASAIIASTYEKSKGEKLGYYSSATLIGRALAPLAGGLIISYFTSSNNNLVSYRYVYLAAFILAIPVFIFITLLKDQKKNDNNDNSVTTINFLKELKDLIANRKLISTANLEMAIYFTYGAFETYLPLYLNQLNVSAKQIGLIFSAQILAIALSKPLFGKLADRIDKRKLILVGSLVIGFSIGFIGFFQSIIAAFILGIMFGLGLSFATVATSSYVAEVSKPEKLGSSLGALSSIMDIGQTIGPFITGVAITYFSYKIGFLLSLILVATAGFIFYFYNQRKNI